MLHFTRSFWVLFFVFCFLIFLLRNDNFVSSEIEFSLSDLSGGEDIWHLLHNYSAPLSDTKNPQHFEIDRGLKINAKKSCLLHCYYKKCRLGTQDKHVGFGIHVWETPQFVFPPWHPSPSRDLSPFMTATAITTTTTKKKTTKH